MGRGSGSAAVSKRPAGGMAWPSYSPEKLCSGSVRSAPASLVTTTVSVGQRTERSAVLHMYEMSTSLKKQKSQLFLGIHWQPIPVSAGRGRGHRAPVELRDCGVGGHRCQH